MNELGGQITRFCRVRNCTLPNAPPLYNIIVIILVGKSAGFFFSSPRSDTSDLVYVLQLSAARLDERGSASSSELLQLPARLSESIGNIVAEAVTRRPYVISTPHTSQSSVCVCLSMNKMLNTFLFFFRFAGRAHIQGVSE